LIAFICLFTYIYSILDWIVMSILRSHYDLTLLQKYFFLHVSWDNNEFWIWSLKKPLPSGNIARTNTGI